MEMELLLHTETVTVVKTRQSTLHSRNSRC